MTKEEKVIENLKKDIGIIVKTVNHLKTPNKEQRETKIKYLHDVFSRIEINLRHVQDYKKSLKENQNEK